MGAVQSTPRAVANISYEELENLRKQIEYLESQLVEARQPNLELEQLREEQSDLKDRLQAASEPQLDELKGALSSQPTVDPALQQRIDELEEQCSSADKSLSEANQLVQTLQDQNKNLHCREQQISGQLDKHSLAIKGLEAEVDKLTKKKNELYEFTMNLGEKVRTAENQAEEVLKAHQQAAAEHAKQEEALRSQLAEALKPNPELEKLRKEHSVLNTCLQAGAEQVKTLESQLSEAPS
uniref:Uncharacterized protein n=1 Tax=Panagrolaimus superbus TaxID=310955 RepID=A0A914Z0P8_9BILA